MLAKPAMLRLRVYNSTWQLDLPASCTGGTLCLSILRFHRATKQLSALTFHRIRAINEAEVSCECADSIRVYLEFFTDLHLYQLTASSVSKPTSI